MKDYIVLLKPTVLSGAEIIPCLCPSGQGDNQYHWGLLIAIQNTTLARLLERFEFKNEGTFRYEGEDVGTALHFPAFSFPAEKEFEKLLPGELPVLRNDQLQVAVTNTDLGILGFNLTGTLTFTKGPPIGFKLELQLLVREYDLKSIPGLPAWKGSWPSLTLLAEGGGVVEGEGAKPPVLKLQLKDAVATNDGGPAPLFGEITVTTKDKNFSLEVKSTPSLTLTGSQLSSSLVAAAGALTLRASGEFSAELKKDEFVLVVPKGLLELNTWLLNPVDDNTLINVSSTEPLRASLNFDAISSPDQKGLRVLLHRNPEQSTFELPENINFQPSQIELELPGFASSLGTLAESAKNQFSFWLSPTEGWDLDKMGNVRALADLSVRLGQETLRMDLEFSLNLFSGALKPKGSLRLRQETHWNLELFHLSLESEDPLADIGEFSWGERLLILKPRAKGKLKFPGGAGAAVLENKNRFELALQEVPKEYASEPRILLRLSPAGVTLYAQITGSQVEILDSEGGLRDDQRRLTPLPKSGDTKSEILIVNNHIVAARIFAHGMLVGFKDVAMHAELCLRQKDPQSVPDVVATLSVDRSSGKPLGELNVPFLHMQLDDLRLSLEWEKDNMGHKWNVQAFADGCMRLAPEYQPERLGGLQKSDAIAVNNQDMMDLAKGFDNIEKFTLNLARPIELEVLDGMFGCTLHSLAFAQTDSKIELSCTKAEFRFKNEGVLEVDIQAGGINLEVDTNRSKPAVRLAFPSRLGLEVRVKDGVQFRGEVGWEMDPRAGKKVFMAAGQLSIPGLPEGEATLTLGTGIKQEGSVVPNVCIYAQVGLDVPLFAGVVIKQLGAGVGLNRRLVALGDEPTPERLLANLDRLKPERPDSWEFVPEGDFYVSLLGTVILASNSGGDTVRNSYVAWLLVSIDTNADIVAAGKLWLTCSAKYARDNFDRPVLAGALALLPRKKTLRAVLTSLPNPAIPEKALAEIFSRLRIRISFYMSPDVVDYFLEEFSYTAELYKGIVAQIRATQRTSILEGTAFVKERIDAMARLEEELRCGPGGVSFQGNFALRLEWGGLLNLEGFVLLGSISVHLGFQISAWLEIGFSKSFKIFGKRITISWSKTFRLANTHLEIGLAGAIAAVNGTLGFSGKVLVSISICGHQLSLSPSFAINNSAIEAARARMAGFEQRLNRLTGREANAVALANSTPATEFWLAFQLPDKGRYLYFPSSSSKWLYKYFKVVPKKSEGELEDVVVFQGAITHLLPGSHTAEELKKDAAETGFPLVITAAMQGEDQSAEVQARALLVEATPQDTELPPNEWLKVESLVQDPRVRSESRAWWTARDRFLLPDYVLPCDFRSFEEVEASGEAGNEIEVVSLFEHGLQRSRRLSLHDQSDFDPANEVFTARVQILRDLLHAVQTDTPHVLSKLVRVSLAQKVSFIRSSQLTPDDNPPVEDLEEAHVVVAHPDPEWICLAPIRQKAALKREVIDNRIVENGTVLVKLPIFLEDGKDMNVEQQLSQIGTFEIYRRMPWESRFSKIAADVFPQLRSYTFKSQDPSGETTTDVRRLLLIPYLFTDTFEVHDSKFVTPGLDSKSEIEYALRHIPPLGVREDEGFYQPNPSRTWPTVHLHIPDSRAQDDLRDFAATISVPELFLDTEQRALKFARLQPKEGQPPGSSSPVLIPKLDIAVEVWAQEMPMTQSGFYVGVDEGAVEPERLAIEEPMESVEGKFLAGVAKAGDPGVMLNTSSFRSGYSYKLYLRPQVAGVRNPEFLRRLPILMTRTKVAEIHKETPLEKFRQAETLEWMPKDLHQEPRKRRLEDYLSLLHFRVNVVYPETASGEGVPAMLAIDWTSADRSMGGAEIVIEDWDDSSQSYRLVREVQERSVFQESQGDFSQSSRWELVRGQQTVSLYNPADSVSTTDGERTAFYVQPTLPVEKAVTDAAAEVKKALGQEKWLEVNRRVSKLWKELATYQTSIYQRNSVALQQNFALVRLLLQYYLMGLRAPTNLVLTDIAALTPLQQGWEGLLERMTDIERTSYESVRVPDAQDSVARQEDLKRAKRVVALLRYRQTCVAEMLTDEDEDVPFPPAEGEILPAAKILHKLFDDPLEENSRVRWFFDNLLKGFDANDPWPPSDWTVLPNLKESLNNLGTVLQAEHSALASFVPRAFHLDSFLGKLKSELGSRTSLRLRPHHVAATQSNEKGERLVMPTPVAEIIPPSDNQPEHAAAYLFNLFEKLGFASDVVCRNPNQLPIEPAELSKVLAATRDAMDAMNDEKKVTCFAVGAWENRGKNLIISDQNTPFGFIKVAVVPNLFLDALSGKIDHAREWFNFRGLTGLNPTIFEKLQVQWKNICSQAEMLEGFPFFHLQARGWRWLTLAAESGRTYTSWALPNRLGHRYRVSIRALSRYEELLRWSEGETQSGVPADAPWRRVDVRRRMLNSENDGNTRCNAPLAVFAHTHPKLIQFSYVLSNEGTRAILNGLSSVRTGFRGADLRFGYEPREGKVLLDKILPKIVTLDFDDPNAPKTVKKSDEMSAPAGDILLFRGERLITLADLPYCYRYGLHARPLYDADGFEPDPNFSPKQSEREPTFVASRPWQLSSRAIEPEDPNDRKGPSMMLTTRLYLTQQKDLFTAEEQLASPPPLRVGMWEVPDLPDFALSYHLLRLISPSRNRTGASQVYREIAMVALPHHGSYGDPPEDSLGLAQIRPGELAKSPATTFYLPVHFNHATGQFYLDIQVELHNPFELNELFLLVARGSLSVGPEKAWLEGGM